MTPEQKAAYVMAQSVSAMATIEGMKAANREREARGHVLAYGEDAFNGVIDQYGLSPGAVMGLFHDLGN